VEGLIRVVKYSSSISTLTEINRKFKMNRGIILKGILMKYILIITFVAILISCSTYQKNNSPLSQKDLVKQYRHVALQLKSEFKKENKSESLKNISSNLIDIAEPLISQINKNKSSCHKILHVFLRDSKNIRTLTLSQVNKRYGINNQNECERAKQLLLNPTKIYLQSKRKLNKRSKKKLMNRLEQALENLDYFAKN
jgi:hypothetical protein